MISILKDGRKLSWIEAGDPAGTPLFFFHGTPGSRNCIPDDPLIAEAGIRLILTDRPGMGLSDPHQKRSYQSWADDVCQLADSLSIGHFHVAGASGGGPHALACAVYAPQRVLSDTLMPCAPSKLLAQMIPGCDTRFIANAGHLMLEDETICRQILEKVKNTGTAMKKYSDSKK